MILKCAFLAYHCVPPLRSPVSLEILRWGNASDQQLEVRSPASYYTLTTARRASSVILYNILVYKMFKMFISPLRQNTNIHANTNTE